MATSAANHAVPCSAGRPKKGNQRRGPSSLSVRASSDTNSKHHSDHPHPFPLRNSSRPWLHGCVCFVSPVAAAVTLLDYGAGNVRSVRNAIRHLGFNIRDVRSPEDILAADRLVFPGVGAFGSAMDVLTRTGMADALRE